MQDCNPYMPEPPAHIVDREKPAAVQPVISHAISDEADMRSMEIWWLGEAGDLWRGGAEVSNTKAISRTLVRTVGNWPALEQTAPYCHSDVISGAPGQRLNNPRK